jgi:transposase
LPSNSSSNEKRTKTDPQPLPSKSFLTERKTYSQDWTNYNQAQCQEKEYFGLLLKNLCSGIEQPVTKGPGRPKLPISDVLFSSVMKVYTTFSGRRATSDLKDCKDKDLISSQPHYNTVFHYLEKPELTPILKSLIEESALPLQSIENNFSVDASGFSTSCYERWFDQKYGKLYSQNKWLKAHITIGNKTNIVTSVEITDSFTHDSTQFMPLINDTAKNFSVSKVMADKAYLSKDSIEELVNAGIKPYIPFKSNTTGQGSEIWKKLFHFYNFNRPTFLKHYHERSNVESTFSMIKRKFGTSLRSKTDVAQKNELLCKILAHNICCLVHSIFELGIETNFWMGKEAA